MWTGNPIVQCKNNKAARAMPDKPSTSLLHRRETCCTAEGPTPSNVPEHGCIIIPLSNVHKQWWRHLLPIRGSVQDPAGTGEQESYQVHTPFSTCDHVCVLLIMLSITFVTVSEQENLQNEWQISEFLAPHLYIYLEFFNKMNCTIWNFIVHLYSEVFQQGNILTKAQMDYFCYCYISFPLTLHIYTVSNNFISSDQIQTLFIAILIFSIAFSTFDP